MENEIGQLDWVLCLATSSPSAKTSMCFIAVAIIPNIWSQVRCFAVFISFNNQQVSKGTKLIQPRIRNGCVCVQLLQTDRQQSGIGGSRWENSRMPKAFRFCSRVGNYLPWFHDAFAFSEGDLPFIRHPYFHNYIVIRSIIRHTTAFVVLIWSIGNFFDHPMAIMITIIS